MVSLLRSPPRGGMPSVSAGCFALLLCSSKSQDALKDFFFLEDGSVLDGESRLEAV